MKKPLPDKITAKRTSPTDIVMFKGEKEIAHIHCEPHADTEVIRKDFERRYKGGTLKKCLIVQ